MLWWMLPQSMWHILWCDINYYLFIPFQSGWSYNPFSGYIDENGDIYGRGTQDMKSVSIQYYTALCRLKANNVTFLRNVYMTLMPGEFVTICSNQESKLLHLLLTINVFKPSCVHDRCVKSRRLIESYTRPLRGQKSLKILSNECFFF